MRTLRDRFASLLGGLLFLYFVGGTCSATYFNWTYARENGFAAWLFLGQIIPTAKAAVWPYFVFVKKEAPWAKRIEVQLPRSIQNFFLATDALARANEVSARLANSSSKQEELAKVTVLIQEAIDSSKGINREELNAIHPELGDRFLDDQIGGARLTLESILQRDHNLLLRSQAGFVRWSSYWNENGPVVFQKLARKYNLETR
jgi:hypothetical protein